MQLQLQERDTNPTKNLIYSTYPRRILRKIFGPVQNEDGFWRIRMNYELNDLIKKRRYSEICKKKQKNDLAGSRDADERKKEYLEEY